MRAWCYPVVAVLLVGCGWGEPKFIDEYVEAECTFALDCYDDAVLTFLGWDSLEACMADRGPEVTAFGDGCEYNKKAARKCVKGIAETTCPSDGSEPDFPAECDDVWQFCDGDSEDSGS